MKKIEEDKPKGWGQFAKKNPIDDGDEFNEY